MKMISIMLLALLIAETPLAETRLPIGEFNQSWLDGWESKSFNGETRYSLKSLEGATVRQAGLFKKQRIDL